MINTIIVTPFLNILVTLYSLLPGHDFGVAVIVFTIIIRIVLWPLASKALHSQKAMQELQPEVEKLKKRYKDKAELNKALMELYKEKEINPMGSCLPTIVQLPFLFSMFYAFLKFKNPDFVMLANEDGISALLYPFVKNLSFVKDILSTQSAISTTFLGAINLGKASVVLAVFAAATQFFQTKMMSPAKNKDETQKMMGQMTYLFPVMTFAFGMSLPAALPLYWGVQSLFAIFQQYWVMHRDVSFMEHLKNTVGKKK
ncbi:hypothetical protein COY62_04375 [bacterium (Candidatus Howlettbacteria) CG_4_10_14_0_8_um_filter_40_9]|nr:MAG: hypothetical protein COY62_04375 [bacterium (Candidatus Howlettbacteria) CG_4_10_14_0_8_um_filter_40_9]